MKNSKLKSFTVIFNLFGTLILWAPNLFLEGAEIGALERRSIENQFLETSTNQ